MKWPIRTKEDFESLMVEVDAFLQSEGVPIHARQIRAIGEVTKRLDIDLLVTPLQTGPIPNVYEGDSLSAHIFHWFDERYGDRLKIDYSVGYSVIILKGDAWLIRCPAIYGRVTILCNRNLRQKYNNFVVNEAGKPQKNATINLLHLIEELPQGLANQLTDDELKELLKYFSFANRTFYAIQRYKGNELVAAAVADFETSARCAIGNFHGHGQSLWASLQAAEKMLKFFIASQGETFRPIHDLSKLALQAHNVGLPMIDVRLIERVQCKAGVRYEQQKYPIKKIVDAHHGALQIASIVTETVLAKTNKSANSNAPAHKREALKGGHSASETTLRAGHFYLDPKLGFSYYCHNISNNEATMIMVESYQQGLLLQAAGKIDIEYQNHYREITDASEIARLKQVGGRILRHHGIYVTKE